MNEYVFMCMRVFVKEPQSEILRIAYIYNIHETNYSSDASARMCEYIVYCVIAEIFVYYAK